MNEDKKGLMLADDFDMGEQVLGGETDPGNCWVLEEDGGSYTRWIPRGIRKRDMERLWFWRSSEHGAMETTRC